MTDETTIEPVAEEPEVAAPEPTEDKAKPEHEPPEWATRRINRLTAKRYEAEARATAAQARAAELEARLATYERPQEVPAAPDPYVLAEQIAAQKVREQEFNRRADALVDAGRKAFKGEFDAAVQALGRTGALFDAKGAPTDFMDAVLECDAPHQVLHYLGTNPDEAEDLVGLSPRAQARALAKLEARLTAAPKPVSNAPAPVRPLKGQTAPTDAPTETDSIEDWMRKREAQRKQAMRR